MSQQEMIQLLDRYLAGTATIPEQERVEAWLDSNEDVNSEWHRMDGPRRAEFLDALYQRIYNSIHAQPGKVIPFYKKSIFRWIAAACIIAIVGIASYVILSGDEGQHKMATQDKRFHNDVAAGKYKARLTLADGTVIVLDSAAEGQLTTQGQTAVINKDGQIIYQGSAKSQQLTANSPLIYNILSTAKGETYTTVLSDGTRIWLNSASSIKFPVAFTGKERRVEITGEAYFEVVHNAAKPFKVSVNGMEVEDLGTEFNINAYGDEPEIKTTLISGSINVFASSAKTPAPFALKIKPGQQAVYKANSQQLTANSSPDLDEVTAWKAGLFSFESADVQTIMRALSRWYDIDVKYSGNSINEKIHFEANRNTSLKNVLKVLELTSGVRFEIEGKRVTVLK